MLRIGCDDEKQRFIEIKVACRNETLHKKIKELLKKDESLEPLMKEFPEHRLIIFMLESNIHMCRKVDFKMEITDGWDEVDGQNLVIKMAVPWDETILSRFMLWFRTTMCNLKKK